MNRDSVVVFIPSLHSGGAEKQAVLLAKYLNDDFTVFLVIWNGNHYEKKFLDYIKANGIHTYYLKGNIITRGFKFYKLLKSHKVKYLFNYLASNNFYGSVFGKLAGVKHIIGGIRNAEIPRIKFLLQRFLHNNLLEYTIFNNYLGFESLTSKGFDRRKSLVIPNCFELSVEPIKRKENEIVKIVSLARFVPQKDYLTALKAINHLINVHYEQRICHFKYNIIGYGEQEPEIRRWIKELNLNQYVELYLNPENAIEIVRESDIFLNTSLFEGTCNAIMEAMSFSLPIVATNAGDNSYLVEHNINGFVAPLRDFRQIANYLFILINNYDLRIKLGANSYSKLASQYSVESFYQKYINFIEKLSVEKTK